MSFDVFQQKVRGLVKRTGSTVRFFNENGKHIARCSDGVTIIGNASCRQVMVKWGSGHKALATI